MIAPDSLQFSMDPNTIDNAIDAAGMSSPWMTIIVASLGGIIVLVFGKLYDAIWKWRTRPLLRVEFHQEFLGCITYTRTNRDSPAATIRMMVTNCGKLAARGCVAYLTRIEMLNEHGVYESTDYCDSMRLAWSCQGPRPERFSPMDIPREVTQYIDIISIAPQLPRFIPNFEITPNRYLRLFEQTCPYRFTVHVHGENTAPVKCKLLFTFKNLWDGRNDSDAFEARYCKD